MWGLFATELKHSNYINRSDNNNGSSPFVLLSEVPCVRVAPPNIDGFSMPIRRADDGYQHIDKA